MDLAQDGAEDGEAREDGGGDYGVSPDADVERACNCQFLDLFTSIAVGRHTIARFVEAVLGVTVARKNCHLMPPFLKADCGIDDQAFGAANAQVWVEEDDMLRLRFFRHCCGYEAFPRSVLW